MLKMRYVWLHIGDQKLPEAIKSDMVDLMFLEHQFQTFIKTEEAHIWGIYSEALNYVNLYNIACLFLQTNTVRRHYMAYNL